MMENILWQLIAAQFFAYICWQLRRNTYDSDHWMNPSEPCGVAYSETFEPYVVVSTDIEPKFDELLLKSTAERSL